MTRKDLLQIPGLGQIIESIERTPVPDRVLIPMDGKQSRLASVGEVWKCFENELRRDEVDYDPLNPHSSTVVILAVLGETCGHHVIFRAAPVIQDIRYCGVEDAILPKKVLGYPAAVAFGCSFTLTSKELELCEGELPGPWFGQLSAFLKWMECDNATNREEFPSMLETGRPFTHPDDPGYVYHARLARNLQPFMVTVLEEIWDGADLGETETVESPEFYGVSFAEFFETLPLSASSLDSPAAPHPPGKIFSVIAPRVWLIVKMLGESRVRFEVEDLEHSTSEALDGATITVAEHSCIIKQGEALISAESTTFAFQIVMPDGTRPRLEELQK